MDNNNYYVNISYLKIKINYINMIDGERRLKLQYI